MGWECMNSPLLAVCNCKYKLQEDTVSDSVLMMSQQFYIQAPVFFGQGDWDSCSFNKNDNCQVQRSAGCFSSESDVFNSLNLEQCITMGLVVAV